MDDLQPVVFQPEDGDGEFAIIIERGDAPILRDALRKAADDRAAKLAKATQRHARTRNEREYRVLMRYSERCEIVRINEAKRIADKINARRASQD
jgi:hypothetical protein